MPSKLSQLPPRGKSGENRSRGMRDVGAASRADRPGEKEGVGAVGWREIARHRTPLCPRDSDYDSLAFHLSVITRSDDVFSCRLKSDSDGMLPYSLAPARPIAVRQLELRCEGRRGEKRRCNCKMCFPFADPLFSYHRPAARRGVPFVAITPIRDSWMREGGRCDPRQTEEATE